MTLHHLFVFILFPSPINLSLFQPRSFLAFVLILSYIPWGQCVSGCAGAWLLTMVSQHLVL